MIEKKYKLKKEAKKFCVASHRDKVMTHDEWSKKGFNKEALEKVPYQKIEIILNTNFCENALYKKYGEFTELERKGVECFLNRFGSMKQLEYYIADYIMDMSACDYGMTFMDWVKQIQKYEKNI